MLLKETEGPISHELGSSSVIKASSWDALFFSETWSSAKQRQTLPGVCRILR